MSGSGPSVQVAHAFNRFGLGGRPDDTIPTDPIAWLTGQLSGPDPLSNAVPNIAACLAYVAAVQAAPPKSPAQTQARQALFKFMANEQTASIQQATLTTTPFRERLVRFWTNHFAVQTGSGLTAAACAGHFVRSAIRPYVTDTFANMLIAVMQHPAMLNSLNNDVSVGPQSPRGINSGLGINENLARETLELFTVGIGANYTQADVDALAYMLTGWTVSTTSPTQGFVIDSNAHQPGSQMLMGVSYPGTVFDAYEALQFLGTHPLTYAHIATKLVAHFVSDTPDPNDVATVVSALSASGGSLTAATNAIIGLKNAWIPQTKLRTPADFLLAASRAVAAPGFDARKTVSDLATLGQEIWCPPFPNGWSDMSVDWSAPSQMMIRTNWVNGFCNGFKQTDPALTTLITLGPLISPALTAMLARVTATHDKLAVLFCSPDFQRR